MGEIHSHRRRWLTTVILLAAPRLVLAHSIVGTGSSFAAGFSHPFTGIDHLLAMLSVGIWGALLGGTALWILPVSFPLIMALGAAAGILGVPMYGTEIGIATSVILLGSAIAMNLRLPLAGATALVSVFAIFHGYAHGAELPRQADVLPYCAGFVIATGLIHLAGIAVGLLSRLPRGTACLRVGGGVIAIIGVLLATGLISP